MRAIDTLEPDTAATGLAPVPDGRPVRRAARTTARPFRIPPGGEAGAPIEVETGGGEVGSDARADVRLMVARRSTGEIVHRRFADIAGALSPGDVLVVNTSAVIPAAVEAMGPDGREVRLHLSTEQPGGFWVVEPRRGSGVGSARYEGDPPRRLTLSGGGEASLLAPYPAGTRTRRLWLARLDLPVPTLRYLDAHGQPIRYAHIAGAWPLAAYQSVFSRVPGSADRPRHELPPSVRGPGPPSPS